jgi:glycosyltransferase involved in cell wall biosynthesis
MRIVQVVQGLGIGGQERLVIALSQELALRGHEPAIVSLSPSGELRDEARGLRVYVSPRVGGLAMAGRLARLLQHEMADVVHTHDPAPLLHAMPAALLARVGRRVHTKHGANRYRRPALWAARALVRTTHAVVAVSPQTADVARSKERVPERRLRIIPNGIPLRPFHPDVRAGARVRAELGIAPDAFVVGSVGRLVAEKDYPLLVRSVAHLLSDRFRLVIVGDGDARAEIERAVPHCRSRYVTLTGARRDVPALLASFNLFALSSHTEGLPLAVPEAMACALPVVATAVGGLPSVVPPSCGVLVRPGDEGELARTIGALVHDVSRARALGEAARSHALASFSIERMADAYERVYRGG